MVLKAEPTPELSCSSPSTRQRCLTLSKHSTMQTTAGSPSLDSRLCAGGVALLLQFEECKPPELLLRIRQEKSTNSNRKSKCPLQTCTRYEAIQSKEKNAGRWRLHHAVDKPVSPSSWGHANRSRWCRNANCIATSLLSLLSIPSFFPYSPSLLASFPLPFPRI